SRDRRSSGWSTTPSTTRRFIWRRRNISSACCGFSRRTWRKKKLSACPPRTERWEATPPKCAGSSNGLVGETAMVAALVRHPLRARRRDLPQAPRLSHRRPQLFLSARRAGLDRPGRCVHCVRGGALDRGRRGGEDGRLRGFTKASSAHTASALLLATEAIAEPCRPLRCPDYQLARGPAYAAHRTSQKRVRGERALSDVLLTARAMNQTRPRINTDETRIAAENLSVFHPCSSVAPYDRDPECAGSRDFGPRPSTSLAVYSDSREDSP